MTSDMYCFHLIPLSFLQNYSSPLENQARKMSSAVNGIDEHCIEGTCQTIAIKLFVWPEYQRWKRDK